MGERTSAVGSHYFFHYITIEFGVRMSHADLSVEYQSRLVSKRRRTRVNIQPNATDGVIDLRGQQHVDIRIGREPDEPIVDQPVVSRLGAVVVERFDWTVAFEVLAQLLVTNRLNIADEYRRRRRGRLIRHLKGKQFHTNDRRGKLRFNQAS